MARPKVNEDEKLIPAQTRLAPATIEKIEAIASERDWSFGQTVRKLVEQGLATEALQPAEREVAA